MYKCVGPSEVISSKQKKKEIKLNINLLSKTNKYKKSWNSISNSHRTVHVFDTLL
jgi:hypothetical protein